MTDSHSSFLVRHEFLIRRLHSLSGLVPVGAFMCVHLLANASVLEGPAAFQKTVYQIHGLGDLLPVVEWTFIFIPILFHAIIGVVIIRGGLPNTSSYPYSANIRYTLQRATGMIAFVFIMWHVFHMHGWIHAEWWVNAIRRLPEPFRGANFRPYSAASTAGEALQSVVVVGLYAIGILASVFHLANGIWTMGITWGVWTSPMAQRRASLVCSVFGVALAVVGMSALWGMHQVGEPENLEAAVQDEDKIYETFTESGLLKPNEEKRRGTDHSDDDDVARR